jgi:hypothetical protein
MDLGLGISISNIFKVCNTKHAQSRPRFDSGSPGMEQFYTATLESMIVIDLSRVQSRLDVGRR